MAAGRITRYCLRIACVSRLTALHWWSTTSFHRKKCPNVLDALEFTLSGSNGKPKGYILKSQFAVLDMIRGNNWERPIYFAVTTGPDSYMGLQSYFRLEGLAYRLVPIRYPQNENPNAYGGVAANTMYENVMEQMVVGRNGQCRRWHLHG